MTSTQTEFALVKERVWPSLGYRPHSGQRSVHNSPARNKVNVAGRRAGKSQMGGHELSVEALLAYSLRSDLMESNQRREFWIVGPEYSDSEKEFRVFWDDLKRLDVPLDRPGSYNNPWSGEMAVSLWDGRFIVAAKSAKYPGTLVGEGLAGVILAEAAKLKPNVWHKFIRPTLADFRGWSLFNTTPEGKNWVYELWQRGQDPAETEWASWRMPSWVNKFVYPLGKSDPEILSLQRDMSEERFGQEIAALFTEFVGRVFKDFDEETHVFDLQYNPEWPLYLAMDYGWSNPFVCLLIQIDVWDNIYVLGEYRTQHMDVTDIAKELQTWRQGLCRKALKMYPDPAEPGDTAIMSRELRVQADSGTGGELKWRLELIRQKLKLVPEHRPWEERKPTLMFDRSCVELIREMQDYRYPNTKAERAGEEPENPLKMDDHAPEALGRFMRGYFGGPDSSSGRHVVVRKASMSA